MSIEKDNTKSSDESNVIFENFMRGSILEQEKRFLKLAKKGKKFGEMRRGNGPGSEDEFRLFFDMLAHFFGFRILHYCTYFPDYLLAKDGYEIRAEAEVHASTFTVHKHDPKQCDMIVCWNNNLPHPNKLGLDVFELSTHKMYYNDGRLEELAVKDYGIQV